MILVAGATGFLGREICRLLAGEGHAVRALVRSTSDPTTLQWLGQWGVQTVTGDLKRPVTLAAACEGATAVISTATSTRLQQAGDSIEATDQQGQLNLVDAAEAAGVGRFVYLSYSGNIVSDDPLTRAKRTVERRLQDGRMAYTILRPSFFMEVWLSPVLGFDIPNARAVLLGSGSNPVSWISLADVAAFAAHCVTSPAAADAVLELGGPEALPSLEVVRIFEELGGRPFEVQHVPEDELRARRAAATESRDQAFAALMLACAAGDPIPMEETLRAHPLRLRSVRDYAREALAASLPPLRAH